MLEQRDVFIPLLLGSYNSIDLLPPIQTALSQNIIDTFMSLGQDIGIDKYKHIPI